MGKTESFQDLSLTQARAGEQLWSWLYTELRAAILEGRLKPGSRMPSSRGLAKQYSLSRGTVTAAFDQLHSEGYIRTEVGAGTFVASDLPDESMAARPDQPATHLPESQASLSNRGCEMVQDIRLLPASHSIGKAFRSYEPAIDLFPVNLWSRVAGRVLRRAPRSLYGQGDTRGYLPLRRAVAEYVGAARGVRCTADQVLITSGAQQALDLAARLLIDPGDRAWLEDPGYPGARFALRANGARIIPVPVDGQGLDVEAARQLEPHAKLVYVTPANQFPLGVAMTLERRQALLNWASRAAAWVIEDDYDAEYRYSGQPLPSLQSLDQSGCVIYAGTFTKMLFNSLRLGFLILPGRLVDAFAAARSVSDRHPPTMEQAILAEFILEGHFGHHVRRMRQTYAERLAVLSELSKKYLGGMVDLVQALSGMRTVAWLTNGGTDSAAANRARARGLELAALSEFTLCQFHPPGLVLGFAGCTAAELARGIGILTAALELG